MVDSARAALSADARVAYDGQRREIAELSPPSVLLSGPAGELRRVSISHLVAAGSAVIALPGSGEGGPDTGAALSGLDSGELARLRERVGHVREACTGYRSGSAELALPGEPRPEYGPGTGKLQRYQAKAAELRLGVRTIRRWAAALERYGPAGLIDDRHLRRQAPGGAADLRWLEAAREHYQHRQSSLKDITAETGIPVEALAPAARKADIRVRHGINARAHPLTALGGPCAFTTDIWNIFARPGSEQRIRRLLTLPGQPGLNDAARHLGIRSAILTSQIRQLETAVGTALLRTGPDGRLMLTAYGKRFAHDVRPALESLAQTRKSKDSNHRTLPLAPPGIVPLPGIQAAESCSTTTKHPLPRGYHSRCVKELRKVIKRWRGNLPIRGETDEQAREQRDRGGQRHWPG